MKIKTSPIFIEKIISIAIEAGKIVMTLRKEGFETRTKNDYFDFVTTADLKSEEYILKRLSEEFPNDSILSEEKGRLGKNPSRIWMVDPLDGTKDFKNGGAGFSIMIGLCQNGHPVLGVVFAPAKNLLYFSQKGHGSFLRIDGRDYKLHVSSKKYLNDSIMVTSIPHGEKRSENKLEEFFVVKQKIPEGSLGIKLGLIASRKADFQMGSDFRTSKWDTCAPQIILEEAGGKITNTSGHPLDYNQPENNWEEAVVASNKVLHTSIIKKIKEFVRGNDMKIFVIRHGETTGDVEDRYGGDYDDELSENGKNQAQELAQKLKARNIQAIFYSPRKRAKQTAEIINQELNVKKIEVSDLRERNRYGVLTGLIKSDAKQKFPKEVKELEKHKYLSKLKNSEDYDSFKKRILNSFEKIINSKDFETIAIISHGGPISTITREILKLGEFKFLNDCAVLEIEKQNNKLKLIKLENAELEKSIV